MLPADWLHDCHGDITDVLSSPFAEMPYLQTELLMSLEKRL